MGMEIHSSPFCQFQNLLREMFQFDHNELDFGLFKVLRLKRTYIEQFISGDGVRDLQHIVACELQAIRGADTEDERQWLANRCEMIGIKAKTAWAAVCANPQDPALQTKLTEAIELLEDEAQVANTQSRLKTWLQTQAYSTSHLEAQLYNYLLNYFELYYQNGDFGYNARATSAFKVPYEADYDGADTLFHWKHKDCYYIKTANSFPEVRLEVLGKTVVFRLQAGGDADTGAQNNNKDSDIKQYRLADIAEQDGAWVVYFQLAKAGTPKAEIYARLWRAALGASTDLTPYLTQKSTDGDKPVFKDLGKDHDKAEGGQIKGINQLRLSEDAYLDAIGKNDAFKTLGKNAEARADALKTDATAAALHQLDKALNRFYVGQDADYFIHKDLRGFLTREKDRFIKNVIFSSLEALLDRRADAATLIIARAFNTVAGRIIEFLDATETFQRNLYTLKKKVIDTHWLISVGKIPAVYWPRLLQNQRLLAYFQSEFKQTVASVADLQAQPTLVVDTSLFTSHDERALVDELLTDPAFDNLDEQTDGLLVHSENWQALNLLQDKFRERIKCIYIDPPYNTGGDGFLYKDSFRHSSWASMMADRLELGRNLLMPEGYLFCSIDRDEHSRLLPIAGHVFGEENFIEDMVWQKAYGGGHKTKHINNLHEYICAYAKDQSRTPRFWLKSDPEVQKYYKYEDEKVAVRGKFRTQPLHTNSNDFRKNLTFPIPIPAALPGSHEWGIEMTSIRDLLRDDRLKLASVDQGTHIEWLFYLDNVLWTGSVIRPEKQWQWAWDTAKDALIDDCLVFGKGRIGLVVEYKQYEFGLDGSERGRKPSSIQIGPFTQSGTSDLVNVLGIDAVKFPKPVKLIEEFIGIGFDEADAWVADYFAGSGTTGHAAIALNIAAKTRMRRFMLAEAGDHFFSTLKPRISRIMFSLDWKNAIPENGNGWQGIVKVQRFEQYEDVIANLDSAWDEAAMPAGIPVRYLFRPEENRVRMALDLSRPFTNMICVGKAREAVALDLLESWALLQGYWQRSRRVMLEGGKRYLCLETVCGCLVILRDITEPEDDSAALNAIAARYTHENGSLRIHRLEVNHWADLRRMTLPCALIAATDFDRGAAWN